MSASTHASEKPTFDHPLNVIVATDCGSTTTKAILIQLVDGVYRQTYRGEAPTTVEAPFADVTVGVINATLKDLYNAGQTNPRFADEVSGVTLVRFVLFGPSALAPFEAAVSVDE